MILHTAILQIKNGTTLLLCDALRIIPEVSNMTVIIFFFSLCLFSTSKNRDEDDKQTNHQQTLYIFPLTCLWLYVDSGFSLVPPLNFDHNKYIVQKKIQVCKMKAMLLNSFKDKQTQLLWDFHIKNRLCCQLWVQIRQRGRKALFIYPSLLTSF